jgi:hypothetical protein
MKQIAATVMGLAALVLGAAMLNQMPASETGDIEPLNGDDARVVRGFELAPVPLNLQGKNRTLVGLGSYLVNSAGSCNDCHTCPSFAPGGNPFFGQKTKINATNYMAGGVPFGPFTARNLTPEGNRPAGLTFLNFLKTLRSGIDLENGHPAISPLLQVMPWPTIGRMTERDIRAIYEYLRAIPPAEPGVCSGPAE